jgi:hypothetical protein
VTVGWARQRLRSRGWSTHDESGARVRARGRLRAGLVGLISWSASLGDGSIGPSTSRVELRGGSGGPQPTLRF